MPRFPQVALAASLLALIAVAGATDARGASAQSGGDAPATSAAPARPSDACVKCHGGIEEMHPWQPISCTGCHGGDANATKKEVAHVRPRQTPPNDERLLPRDFDPAWVQFENPGDLRVSPKVCGGCHTTACDNLFKRVDYYALRNNVGRKPMIITHGGDGAYVVEDTGITHVKTRKIEHPVDICGAGDSFTAGAAMAMTVTGSAVEAARIGNLVASVTIMKRGTGTASPAEVLAADK